MDLGLKKVFILLTIFLNVLYSNANKKEIFFSPLSKEQGLPGDNVQAIFQDSYGYIWFGIESVGLCKYDGNRYFVYGMANTDVNSLSTSFINFMVEDSNGDLWLATEHGLNIFNRDEGVFNSYFTPVLPDNRIKTIYKDKSNAIWIGTEKGVRRFIPANSEKADQNTWFGFENRKVKYVIDNNYIIDNIGNEIVNSIIEDNEGAYWFGTFNGLYKCQLIHNALMCENVVINETDITANRINDIAQLSANYLLLGTNVGVTILNIKTHKVTDIQFSKNKDFSNIAFGVTKIMVDSKGFSWIGTNLNGIISGKTDNGKNISIALPSAIKGLESTHIRNIFEDRTGQIWVVTKYAGIYLYDPRSQLFPYYTSNDKNQNFILSACESKNGNIFLGTKFAGMLEYNPETSTIKQKKIYLNNEFVNRIECLYEDANGNLWMGYKKGLIVLDENKNVKKSYNAPKPYGMSVGKSDTFWVFTEQGVYYLNKQTDKVEKYDLSIYGKIFENNEITVQEIYSDKYGDLWLPTSANGVFKYIVSDKKLLWFKNNPDNPNSLSGNIIRSFFQDSRGEIWIGTKFSGLNRYQPESNSFEHFTIADGLPSNAIYSIIEDKNGYLWFSTNNGISKYDPVKKQFFNFNEKHGLQGNVFEQRASIKLTDNSILIGGSNGFNIFSPDNVYIDNINPPLVITNIQADNTTVGKDIFSTCEIVIPYKSSKLITIEFTSLDYRDPANLNYAYQLDGVDEDWVDANKRNYVTYSRLSHGKYTFRFKATNADGIWTKYYQDVSIIIETPFWLKWWAYVIYCISGMALLFGIYRFATIRANYNHQLYAKELELARDRELNQMKLRFFTNISHEIRTPLSLIMAPLQKLQKSKDLNEYLRQKVELIDKSTKRLLKLTDQLLYFRKAQQENLKLEIAKSDIVEFISDIISPFYELADNNIINLRFESDHEHLMLWFDPDKVEKIISNLVSNAFKFTPENGSITVHIHTFEGLKNKKRGLKPSDIEKTPYVKISVSDSGTGMTKEQIEHIFERFYQAEPFDTGVGIGLEFVKHLIETHYGKIEVDSIPGKGTTFSVYLPYNKQVYRNAIILKDTIKSQDYIPKGSLSVLYGNDKETNIDLIDDFIEYNSKPSLLIVEDNEELKSYLKGMFEENYNILLAANGEEGLEITKKETPEIIITDIMMPKMNGIEFCRKVKSDVNISHIPVIMLTAKNFEEDEIEGLHSGADDYISKPFNEDILIARINNIFISRQKLQEKYASDIYIDPSEITTNKTDKQFMEKLLSIINDDITNPELSIHDIADLLNMDRSNFFRKVKSLSGKSPSQLIREYKIKKGAKLLLSENYNINEISYMVGFTSPAYFSKLFKEILGRTPSEFLKDKKG
ncbi:MAG: response regulator [Bacteroidales bacterium]|nr:response regulator [Bacteroidales bacterium]